MAVRLEKSGVDMILVGDSVGMVFLGCQNTVPVTMDEILHHCRAVARGAKTPLLVGDLPFMSYQASISEAVRNAGRILKEGTMDAVKLKGGQEVVPTVKAIVQAGIPVHGHIGITTESVSMLGGFKVQGKDAQAAQKLIDDARALEDASCFAIILECVPDRLAKPITEQLTIPTLGIGSSPWCDGQTLPTYDMIGYFPKFMAMFVKKYVDITSTIMGSVQQYIEETEAGTLASQEQSYTIKDEKLAKLLEGAAKIS